MKKRTLLFLLLPCIILCGCQARIDLYHYMSEITKLYFSGRNEFMDISISVGEREEEYVIDGKSGTNTDFSLVTIKFSQSKLEEEITVNVVRNGVEEGLVMYYNPMTGAYINDLGYALEERDEISLSYDGSEVSLELENFAVGYDEAVRISKQELAEEIKSNVKNGELNGECYLKVLSSRDNQEMFWLFTLVNPKDETFNLLINVQTGEIFRA